LAAIVVSAVKQPTTPPQKRSKKNTPTKDDQEDHYTEEDNRISHCGTFANYKPRKKSKAGSLTESTSLKSGAHFGTIH
jgi:hypothetical protein